MNYRGKQKKRLTDEQREYYYERFLYLRTELKLTYDLIAERLSLNIHTLESIIRWNRKKEGKII